MIWRSRFDLWYQGKKKPEREIFWCLVEASCSELAIEAAQRFAEHSARMDSKLLSAEHRETGAVKVPQSLPLRT